MYFLYSQTKCETDEMPLQCYTYHVHVLLESVFILIKPLIPFILTLIREHVFVLNMNVLVLKHV